METCEASENGERQPRTDAPTAVRTAESAAVIEIEIRVRRREDARGVLSSEAVETTDRGDRLLSEAERVAGAEDEQGEEAEESSGGNH